MTKIYIETKIRSPIDRVFDLSRSIDAHIDSAGSTAERAIAGKTSGLIGLGETVTWSALHFGVRQKLTIRIVEFSPPHSFSDVMVSGAFKSMHHRHTFTQDGDETLMKDYFEFEAPLGVIGVLAEKLVLYKYMERFLMVRNETIKAIAEGDQWQRFLNRPL